MEGCTWPFSYSSVLAHSITHMFLLFVTWCEDGKENEKVLEFWHFANFFEAYFESLPQL